MTDTPDPPMTQTEPRHTFSERVLGRHDWHPQWADRFPMDITIFHDECSVCGKRRERWHRWRDGALSDEDKAVLR